MTIARVAERFGLGRPVRAPVAVTGGLSNQLWRLDTDLGTYAVKRMVLNADRPGFTADVEAAFQIEHRAWAAGVPVPEPIPLDGRALAGVDGSLFRVHRWVDGRRGVGSVEQAAGRTATPRSPSRCNGCAGSRGYWTAAPPARRTTRNRYSLRSSGLKSVRARSGTGPRTGS
jgi:hypothetical protein